MAFDSAELKAITGHRMGFAVLASCLLHGVLLWPSIPPLLQRDGVAVIAARLTRAAPPVVPVRNPVPAPRQIPAVTPVRAVSPASTIRVPESSTSAVVPPAPVAITEVPAGASSEGLRGYRLALATQARQFKRYPPQATAAGWTGTAEIRLELGADGHPRPAQIVRSSGYAVLDEAAQAMVDAAALRTLVPESLYGKGFAVVLPVAFNLAE
jgi:protein TonB